MLILRSPIIVRRVCLVSVHAALTCPQHTFCLDRDDLILILLSSAATSPKMAPPTKNMIRPYPGDPSSFHPDVTFLSWPWLTG